MNLEPMSPANFQIYIERLIVEYADDKVRSGNWPKNIALSRSRDEVMKLLPQGTLTEGHSLFDLTVPEEEGAVGRLWLGAIDQAGVRTGFIYDLWIRPHLRRKGLGAQAMLEAEGWAKDQGLDSLSLHVFGFNQAALALYKKLGYVTTDVNMTKKLGRA